MIEAVDLHFCYGDAEVLKGVNFKAERGKVTVLMGRNGAGKTTLLKHLNGLLRPKSGKVIIDGRELKYDRKSLLEVRKRVFYVFQNPDDQILSPTVWQDVAFGPRNLGLKGERLERVVRNALEAVGLSGYEKRLCSTLSGGEKRRLAIASALAMNPDYCIMDEPSANVDGEGLRMIAEIIRKLREEGKGVVVSTHDADLAKEVGDYFYFMDDGKIVWEGEEFSYSVARKLGIRSFSLGKVILAESKIDDHPCFSADELERAVLKAFEGETVVVLGRDDWVIKELEKYPLEVERL
ncbi:ATP-binding cassette domain-containing protein [Archaeoglobus fulgidus]|uniref:Putative ABC transporter ATP-binding protein AF_0731 n=4 Tax=Archaeoglobus fulgidus TaxID=2234 RepID=Y731_ARCFU|nr:ATP-binding cassette domain-containing protein [Archaeoglobus fulgidus]O29527.2 RecName: Full=Putative ABC transporter ATP-binding protein AF_0731 [Archaeoglobus fulgidus DSM 4304]AIG97606.1 cobalt transport protein ATP-binding protein subunit [Archaeoglobus fulgidus DSM 8774]KUJ93501.1 MAG: Putative ABC transporter ATP-binding protein [Archaeoglobus fulgidus]KUK07100.1 MAG: Putative ABC transporter ATP-binding protein [Archaeoglobus fulgidus]